MFASLVMFTLVGVVQAPAGDLFEAPGLFTVGTPEGFTWTPAGEGEREGVQFQAYLCAREGSTTRVVLTIEGRVHADDKARADAVKGHWNGMLEMLAKSGFKKPETHRPKVDPPLPDRIAYSVSCDDPKGARRHVRGLTIFGAKKTYLIQAIAGSPEEADALMKTIETFRELP